MTKSFHRILCIDNDDNSCEIIRRKLNRADKNYSFTAVSTPGEALDYIEKQSFDLFIIDYLLPGMSGIELCRRLRQSDGETPVIFFGRQTDESALKSAFKTGADEYLIKPDGLEAIEEKVYQLLIKKQTLDKIKIESGFADEKIARCFSFIETF
jgi:CheY-like chemotaxis protein